MNLKTHVKYSMNSMNQFPNVKIATITMSTQLPKCQLALTNIGKYLEIDNEIIGVKYGYADLNVMKGSYSTTIYKKAKQKDLNKINKTLFYNQITIIVNNKGNHVNVKLFGNGSLHLTGCKHVDEGEEVTRILYKKLDQMRHIKDTILLTKDINNIFLDKDNLIYGYNDHQIIGFARKNCYIINKKEYEIDKKTGLFISKKTEGSRKRTLLDFSGREVGNMKIELMKNKNKFYNKNTNLFYDYDNSLIYYGDDMIIGKLKYTISDKLNSTPNTTPKATPNSTNTDDVLEILYDCNPFVDKNYACSDDNKIDTDINCMNVYFNLGFKINRVKLYRRFVDMNYICKYKPESYSGIKLVYKFPIDYLTTTTDKLATDKLPTGHCICNSKCTCRNITFLIFQSGNVIATGFKNNLQIDVITRNFIHLCNEWIEYIRPQCS